MTLNSRRKGIQAEVEVAKILAHYWPECVRNLDQHGPDKRDLLHTPGVHWQVKRTERFDVWAALAQAQRDASPVDVPVVAFRRNRSGWFAVLELSELLPLLALRES